MHILSSQTWLKLSAPHDSGLGANMMHFSGTSSGQTPRSLAWLNYSGSTCQPKGAVEERSWFGACVIASSLVIWVIIEAARYTTMQPLQPWIRCGREKLLRCTGGRLVLWTSWRSDAEEDETQTELSWLQTRHLIISFIQMKRFLCQSNQFSFLKDYSDVSTSTFSCSSSETRIMKLQITQLTWCNWWK